MTLKRTLAVALAIALVFSLAVGMISAAWENGPEATLTVGELDGDKLAVTINVSASANGPIKGYSLGVTYDPTLVAPDQTAGEYVNDDDETVGITFTSSDSKFESRNTNVAVTPDAKDDAGETFFVVVAANGGKNGITAEAFSITYFFKTLNGGKAEFSIANGVTGGDTPSFGLEGSDGNAAELSTDPTKTSGSVNIPKTPITVTIEDIPDQYYTGAQLTPDINVKVGETVLVKGTDYTVTYGENVNVGTGSVTIAPAGGNQFTAESVLTKTFNILAPAKDATWTNTSFTYDGAAHKPTATIDGEALTVTPDDAIDVGSYTATAVSANPNYSVSEATKTQSFTIAKADHAEMSMDVTVSCRGGEKAVSLGLTEADGFKDVAVTAAPAGIVTAVTVEGATVKLTTKADVAEGTTDTLAVTVSSKNFNDFTYKLNLTAKNVEANWTAEPTAATGLVYGVTNEAAIASTGVAEVKDPDGNPVSVVYRAVDAAAVQNAGSRTVTVEVFSDDYGVVLTKDVAVEIAPATVAVTWTGDQLDYDGTAQKPTATVDGGVNDETLSVTVSGAATTTGKYTATAALTVTGGNANPANYTLEPATFEFEIVGVQINFALTLTPTEFEYDGTLHVPAYDVTATDKDGNALTVTEGTDYTVTLPTDSDKAGTYTVTVNGAGGYSGEASATYLIKGAPTYVADSLTLTDGHTSLTANYKFEANGYTLTYSVAVVEVVTNEDETKTETPLEGSPFETTDASYTVSGLQANHTYKVTVTATNEKGDAVSETKEITLTPAPIIPIGGGGGGSSVPFRRITVAETENGSVSVNKTSAMSGESVTVKVEAAEGYELEKLTVTDGSGNELALSGSDDVYTFVMPNAIVTVKATFKAVETETEPETGFVDVAEDAWYAEAVAWAVENEITTGVGENQFAPMNQTTRGEVVTFLWRVAGKPAASITSVPFTDVDANAYYYEAMLWAYETGLTTGTTETTFEPAKLITRAEMVTFLYRQAGAEAVVAENPFNDVEAGSWYEDAVLWAVAEKVTAGTGEGTFEPGRFCSRAETVTFLYNNK